MLVKDALERAASADRQKVMAALLATDTTTGPAHYFSVDICNSTRMGAAAMPSPASSSGKDGKPLTVLPQEDAFADLSWPQRPA